MIRNEDSLWKGLLEDTASDFIRFFHPDADETLDLEKGIQFLDKELEQVFLPENELFSSTVVDKLIKVFTKDKKEGWVLFHIEFQGKFTREFGKRMHAYFYRLLDKYKKRISAHAIFTEASHKPRPGTYKLEFMGTELGYKFNAYKITDQTDEELKASDNPFAIAILAARAAIAGKRIKDRMKRDLFIKDLKIELIRHLISKEMALKKRRTLFNFINFYIRFEFEETKARFDKELHILTKNTNTMGLEEQILEMVKKESIEIGERLGFEKGQKQLKENLIRNFIFNLGYTDQQAAELIQVPVNFVKKLRKQKVSLI